MDNDLYLMHHGIKGMKWGVRRYEDASGHLTPAGKRRYGIQDARKYYKINRLQRAKERTNDTAKKQRLTKRIRRVQTRSDRKHADLDKEAINRGREIVAKNRLNMATIGSLAKAGATAAGAYYLYQNPNTRALVPAALIGGAALTATSGKKVPYYFMENRRYKQVNKKGGTTAGLSKKKQKLRKAAKIAGGVAAVGGAAALAAYGAKKLGAQRDRNKAYNDAYSQASEATRAVMDANRNYRRGQTIRTATSKAASAAKRGVKTAYSKATSSEAKEAYRRAGKKVKDAYNSDKAKAFRQNVKDSVKRGAKSAYQTAKGFVKTKARNKVMSDYDVDDPRTWTSPINNAKDAVSTAKRYYRGAKAAKNRDVVGAVTEFTPEAQKAANKVKDKTSRFRKKKK